MLSSQEKQIEGYSNTGEPIGVPNVKIHELLWFPWATCYGQNLCKALIKIHVHAAVFPNLLRQRADSPNPILSIVVCNGY